MLEGETVGLMELEPLLLAVAHCVGLADSVVERV